MFSILIYILELGIEWLHLISWWGKSTEFKILRYTLDYWWYLEGVFFIGYTLIYGILYFGLNPPPPMGSFDIKNEAYCVRRLDRGFSRIKSDFNNVNLPAYTLAPTAPISSYRPKASNKSHKISTLQADSSHFSGVTLKCINETITSRV